MTDTAAETRWPHAVHVTRADGTQYIHDSYLHPEVAHNAARLLSKSDDVAGVTVTTRPVTYIDGEIAG